MAYALLLLRHIGRLGVANALSPAADAGSAAKAAGAVGGLFVPIVVK